MRLVRQETLPIRTSPDIVRVRQTVRAWAAELRFSLVDQTKLVTAASELARNTLEHGRGGEVRIEWIESQPRQGIRLVFEDRGPGIPDIALAMKEGYTTGNGLGLGLGGAKRLVNEFEIASTPGEGTRIVAVRWA